ncbi:MAG: hypothetical protein WD648_02670, partial [Planctomycetaceae bacterium]
MKIANRSTFGQKLVRYPLFLRLQLQRRWFAMLRRFRSTPPASRRSTAASVNGKAGDGQDAPRHTLLSRNQRVWIFATVTGVVAIAMLVLQISATITANAELASRDGSASQDAQPPTIDSAEQPVAHQHGSDDHVNHSDAFADEHAHHAQQNDKSSDQSPFSLIPVYSEPTTAAPTNPPVAPEMTHRHDPMPAPAGQLEAPELIIADPAGTDPPKNFAAELFGSIDEPGKADDEKPTGQPETSADSKLPDAFGSNLDQSVVESAPDSKSEPDPFADSRPALAAPDVQSPSPHGDVANPEVPPASVQDSFATEQPTAAIPTPADKPSATTDVTLPEPALAVVPEPVPIASPSPDLAPEVAADTAPAQPDDLNLREELKPKSPDIDAHDLPPAATTPESPAIAGEDSAAPVTAEPPASEPAPSGNPDWTTADPAREKSLVSPNMYREKQPAWRLVAPIAVIGDPNEILSADTVRKELNITIIKTTPTKSEVREILSYEIIVRNNSQESVDGLVIEERVPDSLQVADVTPQAAFENGTLRWLLSAFGAGEQRKLEINLLATSGGTAESVTTARALAAVSS